MSSNTIGSKSSGNKQNDELRDTRRRYQKRIDDLIKRQNLELAEMNRRHDRELAEVERANSHTVDRIRHQNQDAITRRDLTYQNDVDNLRKMYARQLEKLMAENQAKLDRARKTSSEDLRLMKEGRDNRVEDLQHQLEREDEARNQQFTDDLDNIRHDERADVQRIRTALDQQHEKEMKELRESRDQEVGRLDRENREMYQADHQQLRDQQNRFDEDKARSENAHMNNLLMRDEAHNQSLARARQGFNEDLGDIRHRYAKQREKDLQEESGTDAQFHDRVADRMNREIDELKMQLARERNRDAQNALNAEAKAKREVGDMRDEYETKFDYLENAREQAVADNNRINANNIRKLHRKYDHEMMANSRQILDQKALDDEQNREAFDNLKEQTSIRDKYESDHADARVSKIRKSEEQDEKQLRDDFDADVRTQREAYDEKKRDMVYGLSKTQADALRRVEARAEKHEIENQEEVANLQTKFKSQIRALQDQLVRERREHDEHDRRLVKEMKREESTQLATLKSKYDEKARITELTHERQMDEISRRNQEKLDQVVSTVNKEKA